MKAIPLRALAPLFFTLMLPGAAPAAEEPDVVYAKYHRAAASGDLEGVVQYVEAAQRAEILQMSPAQKNAMVKMTAATMPRAFALRNKAVAPDGKLARLLVSGPGEIPQGSDKPETLYGTIRMVLEGGEWKVGETVWSNNPPAALAPVGGRPGAAPAQKSAAPTTAAKSAVPATKSAPPASGGGLVGSTSTPPTRKLGQAKEPCVYKPVMTAEDVENCK